MNILNKDDRLGHSIEVYHKIIGLDFREMNSHKTCAY